MIVKHVIGWSLEASNTTEYRFIKLLILSDQSIYNIGLAFLQQTAMEVWKEEEEEAEGNLSL